MKYFINVNQVAIVENGWHEGSSLETWALFDFLHFFINIDYHKTLRVEKVDYFWINYAYISKNLPLCNFHNAKIKKHLQILADFGLIELQKDTYNNVYFRFLPKHKALFLKEETRENDPVKNIKPSQDLDHPPVKNLTTPSQDLDHKKYKESRSIKNQEIYTPRIDKSILPPKGESEFLPLDAKEKKSKSDPLFEEFWNLYRLKRSEGKKPALLQWQKAIKKIKPEELIRILKEHIKEWEFKNIKEQYIPHARTWLSQERYLDQLDNTRTRGANPEDFRLFDENGQEADEVIF